MSAESVKVIVRCRPFNNRECTLRCKKVVNIITDTGQCSLSNPLDDKVPVKNFFFDGAFDCDSTTESIYNDIGYPLVEGVTEGYNGTIFAYGQTGCGKSFTMQGIDDAPQRGIIPRSFDHIFETISVSTDTKFLVYASFLEIYNEEIRDLLGKDTKARLDLKEHPEKGVFVAGLSMHQVSNVKDCQVIMNNGWKNRSTGATLMNADSSRSHSIFTIYLEMASGGDTEKLRAGKLNLVDLAGSERQSKTGACGDRFKEATKINLSLSALGNVISALVDSKAKHIPYRDSKLTRLLQDSLGGNTKTLMIACLSPADDNYDETLSTLRYANRAKNIQNKPTINEDPKDALLRQYQAEIIRLKEMLEAKQTVMPLIPDLQLAERQKLAEEKEQLRHEYEARLREKELQCYAEMADKAKLLQELQELREHKVSSLKLEEEILRNGDGPVAPSDVNKPPQKVTDSIGVSVNLPPTKTNDVRTFASHQADLKTIGDVIIVDPEGNAHSQEIDPNYASKNRATVCLHDLEVPSDKLASVSSIRKVTPDTMSRDDLLKKLSLLESGIIGGEQATNLEIRARRTRRQKHAEERKRKLQEANTALEDEGIMVEIYETIQDELEHKGKLLQKAKQKCILLKSEIQDLQSEFEQDRSDYLDTIRRQQRQLDLLQSIIDRIQPCIRRDSNYHNVDKIKRQARYDEEKNEWILPPMTVERTYLPAPLAELGSPSRQNMNYPTPDASDGLRPCTLTRDTEREQEEEARFYAKLASRTQVQQNYFKNRRASQLLIDAATLNSGTKRIVNSTQSSTTHNSLLVAPPCENTVLGLTDEVLNTKPQLPRKLDNSRLNGATRSPPNLHGKPK